MQKTELTQILKQDILNAEIHEITDFKEACHESTIIKWIPEKEGQYRNRPAGDDQGFRRRGN